MKESSFEVVGGLKIFTRSWEPEGEPRGIVCAFCIDMHTKDARAMGETEQRLYALNAWRETPFYTNCERAALAWAETVTLVSQTHVPDEEFATVHAEFSEEEIVKLTMAIITINGWNRLAISFRETPGIYQPAKQIKKTNE